VTTARAVVTVSSNKAKRLAEANLHLSANVAIDFDCAKVDIIDTRFVASDGNADA
jgi:hypothetical protein